MTCPKKPGLAFWTTVALFVLLVGYPLSWGPASYLRIKLHQPAWLRETDDLIYAPVDCVFESGHTPRLIREPMEAYLIWWIHAAH